MRLGEAFPHRNEHPSETATSVTQAGVQRVTTFLRRLLLPALILALLAPTAASAMVPPVEISVPVNPNAPKVISATRPGAASLPPTL